MGMEIEIVFTADTLSPKLLAVVIHMHWCIKREWRMVGNDGNAINTKMKYSNINCSLRSVYNVLAQTHLCETEEPKAFYLLTMDATSTDYAFSGEWNMGEKERVLHERCTQIVLYAQKFFQYTKL